MRFVVAGWLVAVCRLATAVKLVVNLSVLRAENVDKLFDVRGLAEVKLRTENVLRGHNKLEQGVNPLVSFLLIGIFQRAGCGGHGVYNRHDEDSDGSPVQKRYGILGPDRSRFQKNFGVIDLSTGAYEWDATHELVNDLDIYDDELRFAVTSDGTILTTLKNANSAPVECVLGRYEPPERVRSLIRSNSIRSRSLHSTPPTHLQEALKSVLQGCSSPAEHCTQLIIKQNCASSVPEWNAAHQLLVLAVKDGNVKGSECVNGNVYHWRDQLYCTVADLEITSNEEKNHIYKCLQEAHKLGLIDSSDAYIEGIYVRESVRKEIVELKRAGLMLLERVLALEGSVEKLKTAFERYRETQMYSNLVGIAVQLIPIVGGSMSKVLMAGCEIVEGLSAGDVVEYALSIAEIVLEEREFGKLPVDRQEEVKMVFEEYGYSREDVRLLMKSRGAQLGGSGGKENSGGDGGASAADDVGTVQLAVQRADELNVSADNNDESISQMTVTELAEAWTQRILGSSCNSENEVHDTVVQCLAEYLRREDISAETLKAACEEELKLIVDDVIAAVDQSITVQLKRGQQIRLRAFVNQFAGST
ncbi:hypothetical protein FGB62_104g113 [Gracilaria domingensis]|nr:hypothetical protein FGB62_104g113 [Gracilaria domingensis]